MQGKVQVNPAGKKSWIQSHHRGRWCDASQVRVPLLIFNKRKLKPHSISVKKTDTNKTEWHTVTRVETKIFAKIAYIFREKFCKNEKRRFSRKCSFQP
jgi:hypothetical protein